TGFFAQTERYCAQFWALAALRDPAPPASSPRWGFGGGGDGRRTTEGDSDGQGKVEAQARTTHKRQHDQDPQQRKANDCGQDRTTQVRYRASGSPAAARRIAADFTPRKQKGSHHCNVARARWRHHRSDGTCSEVATPFGPRLSRRCRAQEAWP